MFKYVLNVRLSMLLGMWEVKTILENVVQR